MKLNSRYERAGSRSLSSILNIVGDSASQWSKRGKMIELQGLLLNIEVGPKVDDS